MENKALKSCLFIFISIVLVLGSFSMGAVTGYLVPKDLFGGVLGTSATPTPEPCTPVVITEEGECPACNCDFEGSSPKELETLFEPFWEVWGLVHQNYVDQPLDTTAMMRGAIKGMLESLGDKHTSYMDPEEYKQANESLEGEYEGIGAWVDITGDFVEVVSPMKGSPAEAAGLRPKDRVIGINGEDMTGIPGDLVLQRILGPAGEVVVLTIQRGEETFDVSITRAKIVVPTVDYEMLEGDVGYVALYTFNEFSTPQLRNALDELLAQNPKGLILDLRDNGGGYLVTAIEVASEFIAEGVVMYEEYGDGTRDSYEAKAGGRATEIPLVVLVNEGTASASEIVAGAIQDRGRGTLVGVVTYGKGTVQNWIPLSNEQGGVRITIARWLTPNGNQISEIGLTPEHIVEYTEEDFEAEIDPQLDKAVELILEGAE